MFESRSPIIRFPATPEESVTLAEQAIAQAAVERAGIICFPECFVPGYRGMGEAGAAARPCFPRTRLVRHRGGRGEGESSRWSSAPNALSMAPC